MTCTHPWHIWKYNLPNDQCSRCGSSDKETIEEAAVRTAASTRELSSLLEEGDAQDQKEMQEDRGIQYHETLVTNLREALSQHFEDNLYLMIPDPFFTEVREKAGVRFDYYLATFQHDQFFLEWAEEKGWLNCGKVYTPAITNESISDFMVEAHKRDQ